MIKLSVENLYGGGAVERFHGELEKVLANIVDQNTPAKKPRKVKLEMTIKPNEQRNMAEVTVTTSCSLQAPEALETSIYIGAAPHTGEIGASETGDCLSRFSRPKRVWRRDTFSRTESGAGDMHCPLRKLGERNTCSPSYSTRMRTFTGLS